MTIEDQFDKLLGEHSEDPRIMFGVALRAACFFSGDFPEDPLGALDRLQQEMREFLTKTLSALPNEDPT